MSNTILISGSSETISLTVQPQVAGVNLSISEAVGTNTVEINQFAGDYVSTIEGGSGIDVSSVGTVTTVSLASDISSFETDPVFTASPAGSITSTQVSNWDTAYNDSIESLSFDTSTGVLTATQVDDGTLTVDLDGRYLTTLGTLTDKQFAVYNSTSGELVDAPARFVDSTDTYVEFYDNTVSGKGSVSLEFNALAGDATPDPDRTVNSVSVIDNVNTSLNTTIVTVYDSTRNLFYSLYKQSADNTLRYDVFNTSGERTLAYQTLLTSIDFGTRIIGPSIYSADLDVVFIPLGNSGGSNQLYVIDPSDFSVVDNANFGVVTSSGEIENIYSATRGSHYSHSLGSIFLSQSGGTVSVLDFSNDTLSNHRSIDAIESEELRTNVYDVFEDTDTNDIYCVDENRQLYIYSDTNDTFTTVGNKLPQRSSLTNITFAPGTDSFWFKYADASFTTDTLAKYDLTDFGLTTIDTYSIDNIIDDSDRLYIQYNDYDESIYATSFGTIDVYDPSTDTTVFTSTVSDIKGLLGETVMFSTIEDKMFSFSYTVIQETIRDYATAVKLDYGDYTQPAEDAPVDPKLDIELTADGANYVAHSGDTISHHFFTNDSAGEDTKVLSIGDQTLYVFNTDGENSTITKAKIDTWDGYGAGLDSVSFNTSTGLLTITDTADVDYSVSLEGRYLTEETVTSISFANNTLTYTDEDGVDTDLDLSSYLDNTDTTYDLSSKANATDGVDIDLTAGGDGSGVDTVTIVGTNDITVSTSGNVITVDAPHETTTSISLTGNSLDYVDEDGTTTSIDLSSYLDNENDFVTAASLGVDNVLTLTVSNQNDVTVSLSSLVVSDTNDFLTTASFTNGTLTLGVSNQSDVTVSLDGRYLQSETLTSLSFLNDTLTYTDENGTANGIDLSIYNETNTSLTFNGETSVLTYTDEDGTANAVDISSLEETNTSLTFNGETSVLTYTDENGTANAVDISSLEETLTSLSFSSETNSLTYTDEDGTENAVSIDALSETLTSLSYNGTNQTLTYTDEDGTDNVLDISETTTSISFTGDTLTYTDEDGTDTDISLAKYNETLTSLTFATDILTYTDEDGTDTTIDLSGYNETLTSLSYSSGTLTYTDEDGTDTALDISGLSGDTTYDLSSAANATEGADIKLVGSDTTTDSINVVGTNAVTVTGAAGTITIDAPEETLTSLSYANDTLTYTDEDGTSTDIDLAGFNETLTSLSIASNILTYTDEDGTETDIDLSLYLDDTNLARLTSGTLDGATGIATFTRDDATTFTVDFSDLLDDTDTDTTYDLSTKNNATAGIDLDLTAGGDGSGTDTVTFKGANAVTVTQASNVVTIDVPNGVNDFVDGATFNTANGELTLSVGNQSDVVVDLDGRYLQSYSETDTLDSVATRGNTTDQSIKIGEDGGTPDTELHVVGAITIEGDTAVSGTLTNVAISQNINSDLTSYSTGQDSFLSWANNFDIADKTVYKKIAGSGVAQYFISSGSAASAYDNFERHLRIDSSVTNPHFIRWDIGQWSGTGDTYKDISSTTGAAFSIGRLAGVGARTELFRLDVDGDLTISGGYGNLSSIKYKKNVQDLEDRTEDVMSLRPVRYELKANDKKDIGFIAEEVAEIFPEFIGYKDGEVNSIDYSRLTVVLLQQVQKQQYMIDALSERITKLEK